MTRFTPEPFHCAGAAHFTNGGILATVIDCHCICTAAAAAYRDAGREIGSAPDLFYVTARLELAYLRPTPVDAELTLAARIKGRSERGYVLSCELTARGKPRVTALVEAVRVPESWVRGDRSAE